MWACKSLWSISKQFENFKYELIDRFSQTRISFSDFKFSDSKLYVDCNIENTLEKIKGFDPEISYIIDQDYCGKGIGYKGVKMAMDFLSI